MLDIQQIIEYQQLEEYLLNIEVERENKSDLVLIELQGNEFTTEDTLLKDAYNIFLSASSIDQLSQIELIWHTKVDGKDQPLISMTLTKENMEQLVSKGYADIPTIATKFERH